MEETLLRETFLFGNIRNVYSTREIKKMDLLQIKSFLPEIKCQYVGEIWRSFFNFRTLFKDREVDILNDVEKYQTLINIYRDYTTLVEGVHDIKDKFVNLDPKEVRDHFKITIYIILSELLMILKPLKNRSLNEMVGKLFPSYLPFIRYQNVLLYFNNPPPGDKFWKPEWKFVYENKEITLDNIDFHLDNYFQNYNFQYTYTMKDGIEILSSRLEYLNKNAPKYLGEFINPRLEEVTRNIFDKFPYRLVYHDYPKLFQYNSHVYHPPLYNQIRVEDGFGWIMSIIPLDVSTYLLGYPVVTCDVPSEKNISDGVKKLHNDGIESYLSEIRKRNKQILEGLTFNISVANGTDEEGYHKDILEERVVDYNHDDVFVLYDTGVVFYLTTMEFDDILKRRLNPYNRSKIDNLGKITDNRSFKTKRREKLKRRGVEVSLNGTMSMNLEEIREAVINGSLTEPRPEPKYRHDVREPGLFRLIMDRRD